jgi:predicted MPP superfamily phosphohydrolase
MLTSPRDPPTFLDSFLFSPLLLLIRTVHQILLRLRGAPFLPSANKPPIRIVCISDTHCNTLPVAAGDLLIHAGDLTNRGTHAEIQAQIDWLASLPHKQKIAIGGNHDSFLDERSRREEDKGKKLDWKGIHYLEDESITLKFKGGRKLNFYGSPDIPQCGGKDFAYVFSP